MVRTEWKKSLLVLLAVMMLMTGAASAASTELTITKVASDGTTVLQQKTERKLSLRIPTFSHCTMHELWQVFTFKRTAVSTRLTNVSGNEEWNNEKNNDRRGFNQFA